MDIHKLKHEIETLRAQLLLKENQLTQILKSQQNPPNTYDGLSSEEVCRYSRQMVMPQITSEGQIALKNSKVLIVGIGGLGCPAALYLVAAGVGELTLVDGDDVELSNLHRQILHNESNVGTPKVNSAFQTLKSINSKIEIIPKKLHADSSTIKTLLAQTKFNVVIDGTDNVATRYLLNDICVLNKIPLVSGSALQMEGQLTVYNYNDGPCYRCLFPKPPPPETVTSCGDGGVLGAVPGVIGILQALETIKIIVGSTGVLAGRMLVFDGTDTVFRNVILRKRNPNCDVCGSSPRITDLIDYEQFCGAKSHDKVFNIDVLTPEEHVEVERVFNDGVRGVFVDVRPKLEFSMCRLPNFINIPFSSVQKCEELDLLKNEIVKKQHDSVYVICRRGNDSQRAIGRLKQFFSNDCVKFFNVKGGLHAYSAKIDPSFPVY